MNKVVDFFLIGWPKTGSTSLNYYLSQHPEIYMATTKESYFFSKDFVQQADQIGSSDHFRIRSWDDYSKIFMKSSINQIIGESSVFYSISEDATCSIRDYNSDAKIILILREPTELLSSWYSYLKLHNREDAADLMTAIKLQKDRTDYKNLPALAHMPIHYAYDYIIDYPLHLNRLFSHFPRENVCIILYKDFKNDASFTLNRIFEFLGVDSDFIPNLSQKNLSRKQRNKSLKKFIDSIKHPFTKVLRKLGLLSNENVLHRFYLRLFTIDERRDALSKDEISMLKQRYKRVVIDASKILDVDLVDKWNY